MFQSTRPLNPYAQLREAMERVIATTHPTNDRFDALPSEVLADLNQPGWGSVLAGFDATKPCQGLTSVAVSKILHRKRPALVPLIDQRVRTFYRVKSTSELIERIHLDVNTHAVTLGRLRALYTLPNGESMSRLRSLDIIVWMRKEKV